MNPDPWTLYWHQNRLQSCIAVQSPEDEERLAALWAGFARTLDADARVLDLATGNGVVPVQLLTAVPTLRVTGVDRAAITPARHVAREALLSRVRFCGEVDLGRLPSLGGPFDALTSQLGVEYAGLEAALGVLESHLTRGGVFQWLLHHAESTVVESAARDRAELERLLAPDGVLAVLEGLERGERSAAEMDDRVRGYLGAPVRRTRRISGAVVALVERAVTAFERGDRRTLSGIVRPLQMNLSAEHERLRQLEAAALDADDLERLVSGMAGAGAAVVRREPLLLGTERPALIGWVLAGHRQ